MTRACATSGALLLVLLAGACSDSRSQAAETPEQAFRKIEQAILDAKTLRIGFDWGGANRHKPDPECGARRTGCWGELLLAEGNRIRYADFACAGSTGDVESVIVSDGARLREARFRHHEDRTPTPLEAAGPGCAAPADLTRNVRVALARCGRVGASYVLGAALSELRSVDVREMYVPSEFTHSDTEGGLRTLAYTLWVRRAPVHKVAVKVWYDPKSYRMVRMMSTAVDLQVVSFDEFGRWEIDGTVRDGEFEPTPSPKSPK